MLGGMGSPLGAVLGGLLVGVAKQLCAGLVSSKYKVGASAAKAQRNADGCWTVSGLRFAWPSL